MGRPVLRAIPGSSHPRLGLGGYIRNVFTKAEFKCLSTIAVGGFESEEDGKRRRLLRRGLRRNPRGGIPASVRQVV